VVTLNFEFLSVRLMYGTCKKKVGISVVIMNRAVLKYIVGKNWAGIMNRDVLIDLRGNKKFGLGVVNNVTDGFEISSEKKWDGHVRTDNDFATGGEDMLIE
jgi:hypothetical protein